MEKHLLVACGDEYQTSQSLRFAHHFFTRRDELKLTLFYVVPRRPDWRLDPINLEANPEALAHIEQDKLVKGVPAMAAPLRVFGPHPGDGGPGRPGPGACAPGPRARPRPIPYRNRDRAKSRAGPAGRPGNGTGARAGA